MIEVKGLQKRFGSFEALKGIELNVQKGEIYGFLGHNGAGKSTTINILAGLSKADGGSCFINGWDLEKVVHPGDLHVGYLPEEPKFYPWMTARENLLYLGSQWKKSHPRHRVEEMLEWVGLTKAANRRVGGYSRGMKQRLGMAAALFHDANLVLLDEPSSALDPEGRSDVLNLILDLKARGKTVFLSTHILSDVERVCDRVGILSQGRMTIEKPLKVLLAEYVTPVYVVVLQQNCDEKILHTIRELPGILDVAAHNETLSITVDKPAGASRTLLAYFASSDAALQSISLKRASLEDIFLEEVGKHEHESSH